MQLKAHGCWGYLLHHLPLKERGRVWWGLPGLHRDRPGPRLQCCAPRFINLLNNYLWGLLFSHFLYLLIFASFLLLIFFFIPWFQFSLFFSDCLEWSLRLFILRFFFFFPKLRSTHQMFSHKHYFCCLSQALKSSIFIFIYFKTL